MPLICPTIDAYSEDEYRQQIMKIAHLGHRIQIDLTDGYFTKEKNLEPDKAWWPAGFKADFHLMYKKPIEAAKKIIRHKPHLIIIHAEAEGSFEEVAAFCKHHNVKIGVALLPPTAPETISVALNKIDHVMIFSGNLGYQSGATADLALLEKAQWLRQHAPDIEIGWDGGINDQNVSEIVAGGIDVLNVGEYIQAAEDPAKAFDNLQRIADETGET